MSTKEVMFVCQKYPELNLVMESAMHVVSRDGVRVYQAGRHIQFQRTSLGGIYKTFDPAEIEFIRTNAETKEGNIIESVVENNIPAASVKLVAGAINSRSNTIKMTPKEEKREISAVRTPKKKLVLQP